MLVLNLLSERENLYLKLDIGKNRSEIHKKVIFKYAYICPYLCTTSLCLHDHSLEKQEDIRKSQLLIFYVQKQY